MQEVLQAQDPGSVANSLVDLLLGNLPQLEGERHVVVDREVGVQRVALEDHGDVPVPGRKLVHLATADPDRPLADLLEAGDHAKGGRLPTAGRAHQDHEFAVPDSEIERGDGLGPVGVDLVDVLELDLRHPLLLTRAGQRHRQVET
jgi:hypothetical protein